MSTAIKRADAGEKKPRSRAKRAAAPLAPATIGQIMSMRETQLGFLGRLDIDAMAMVAAFLLMDDIQTLASILVTFPMSVRTNSALWAAFDVRRFLSFTPGHALAWLHTITSIIDDAAWRAKMWDAIVAGIVSAKTRLPALATPLSSVLFPCTARNMLMGDFNLGAHFNVPHQVAQLERYAAWFVKAMRGQSIKQAPLEVWGLCAELIVRCRDVSAIATIPLHGSKCEYPHVYRCASLVSAEKTAAVLAHFSSVEAAPNWDAIAKIAFELERDDDLIELLKSNKASSHHLKSNFYSLYDTKRFRKLYHHMRLSADDSLEMIFGNHSTNEEIVQLLDSGIHTIYITDIMQLDWDARLKALARYGHLLPAKDIPPMWGRFFDTMTPAVYEQLSAIPCMRAARNVDKIAKYCWDINLRPLLVRDGLVVTENMLFDTLDIRRPHQWRVDTVERIKYIMDHIELTPALAIRLLALATQYYDTRKFQASHVAQSDFDYVLERIQAQKFPTAEVADYCSATLRSAPGAYGAMFAMATAARP